MKLTQAINNHLSNKQTLNHAAAFVDISCCLFNDNVRMYVDVEEMETYSIGTSRHNALVASNIHQNHFHSSQEIVESKK